MKKVVAALTAVPALAFAQEGPRAPVMEALPPHLEAQVERARTTILPAGVGDSPELQGVYYRAKTWTPGQELKVCFWPGADRVTRSRIARTAKQWETAGNI